MTRSILIVGSERGLGLGLAREFFARGWSVFGTSRPGTDTGELEAVGTTDPSRIAVAPLDVTAADQIGALLQQLGNRRFDAVFSNAGIWGAMHQRVAEASDAELAEVMLTNAFGPFRLARRLLNHLVPGGTLCFMSSHRASIAANHEGGLELYRAGKVTLNMLARGLWAENRDRKLTVLSIHPGWVRTEMGTLGGTVAAEMELAPSVAGVANVVEHHAGSGDNRYCDWQDRPLDW